jgi:hypothetical protein
MGFKGKTLDDIIKFSEVEVLLSSIDISLKGTVVKPVKCPAVGRKDDYLKNMNGDPTCIRGEKKCPYFREASFHLEDYSKRIICDAISLEDVKGR